MDKKLDIKKVDTREFRPVPEWLCSKHKALKKFEVAEDGAVRTINGKVYLWSPDDSCREFGYEQEWCFDDDKDEKKGSGWWLAKGKDGWFLRPDNWRQKYDNGKFGWSKRGQIPLQRIVAAAWCPREEGQDCVMFGDGDKFNVCADNLYWARRSDVNKGKQYAKGRRVFEWEDRFDKMTAKEIMDDLAARGIKVSQMTVYKYIKEHNGNIRKCSDEEILAMYDSSITQKENVEKMVAAGLKVSQPKLSILLKYLGKKKN